MRVSQRPYPTISPWQINPYAQQERLQNQQNIATTLKETIDDYGGLQVASRDDPDLVFDYYKALGMDDKQAKERIIQTWGSEGVIAPNQERRWAQNEMYRNRQTLQPVEQPQQQQPSRDPGQPQQPAPNTDGKLRMMGEGDPETPFPDYSSTWETDTKRERRADSPPPGTRGGVAAKNMETIEYTVNPLLVHLSEDQQKLVMRHFGEQDFLKKVDEVRRSVPEGSFNPIQTVQSFVEKAEELEKEQFQFKEQRAEQKQLFENISERTADLTLGQIEDLLQDKETRGDLARSEAYMNSTYKREDLAKELIWDELNPALKEEVSENGMASGFDPEKLQPHYKAVYDRIDQNIKGLIAENKVRAQEAEQVIKNTVPTSPSQTEEGRKFAATTAGARSSMFTRSPAVQGATLAYISNSPGDAADIANYNRNIMETDPDLYFALNPGELSKALQQANLDSTKQNNRIIKATADKMDTLVGDPEYMAQYSALEKAQQAYNLELTIAQMAALKAQGQGQVSAGEYLKVITEFAKLAGNKELSKETRKIYEDFIQAASPAVHRMFEEIMPNLDVSIKEFLLPWKKPEVQTTIKTAEQMATENALNQPQNSSDPKIANIVNKY